jgi:dihydrolipoamide dehydrogenase
VDVAILGAGTAGLAAYKAAAETAERVVLIECGPQGTTCARVGCIPSKLLIAAAEVAHTVRGASRFGIDSAVRVDGRAVMARIHEERDRFVEGVLRRVARIPAEHRILGQGRFSAPGMIEVNGQTIEARAVVIATGSSPFVPPMFASIADRIVVNDDVFEWTTLPESVAVFGSGAMGLELGQALHRLGVRVRVFGHDGRVGPLRDPIVRAAALQALRAEMPFDADAKIHEIRREGAGVAVEFEERPGHPTLERFAFALVTTGRRPNLAALALENAGVPLGREGVPLFERTTLQCGSAPVFIAGDATDDVPVLHEAVDEGRIAGKNAALYPNVESVHRRSRLQITFCDPQIAIVGERFEELSRRGDLAIGEVNFDEQGRCRILGRNRGIGRLYADANSGRFLGAEIAGPSAEHLGHLLAWAHQQTLTIDQMLALPIYHPVVEEGLHTALSDARAKIGGVTFGPR